MARIAKNQLHVVPIAGGRWLLHGWLNGKQIRKRSLDAQVLNAERKRLEEELAKNAKVNPMPRVYSDRLTWDQIRDCEAAVLLAEPGRRLVEYVKAGLNVLPPLAGKSCADALAEWLAALAKRNRSARTVHKNTLRIRAFLSCCGVKQLDEIRPAMIEDYVLRAGRADYTKITDAQVVRAWLNFCVKRRWLLVSPFEIDMSDLSATARTKNPAKILSPEQCHALLRSARRLNGGLMAPYVILAAWCFMSPQEIIRTTAAKMKLDGAVPVIEVDTVKRRTAKFRTVSVPVNVLHVLRKAVNKWPQTREVDVNGKKRAVPFTVPFARKQWDRIRADAGLLERDPSRNGRRRHRNSVWQDSILRHTGISYLNQSLSEKARRGEFHEKSVIAEVCRQAGNTTDTSFRHYLNLPAEGAAGRFYGRIASR